MGGGLCCPCHLEAVVVVVLLPKHKAEVTTYSTSWAPPLPLPLPLLPLPLPPVRCPPSCLRRGQTAERGVLPPRSSLTTTRAFKRSTIVAAPMVERGCPVVVVPPLTWEPWPCRVHQQLLACQARGRGRASPLLYPRGSPQWQPRTLSQTSCVLQTCLLPLPLEEPLPLEQAPTTPIPSTSSSERKRAALLRG